MQSDYITVREASERSNMSIATIYQFLRGGELPFLRLTARGKMLIKRVDFEELLEIKTFGASADTDPKASGKRVRTCTDCGKRFMSLGRQHVLCLTCRRDHEQQKNWTRRAQTAGEGAEKISFYRVFQRDGGLCGICHESVDPRLEYPDPLSGSLDHIIPLSRGGKHVLANVQLAHFTCNCRKPKK